MYHEFILFPFQIYEHRLLTLILMLYLLSHVENHGSNQYQHNYLLYNTHTFKNNLNITINNVIAEKYLKIFF